MKVFVALLIAFAFCSNFAVKTQRYQTECYYENLSVGDRLEISYEVTQSTTTEFDIDFTLHNPDGSLLHQVDKHKDAAFGFNAGSTGSHQLCFINKNSYAYKTISFSFIGPDDLANVQAPKDASEDEKALSSGIQSLSNDMRFMKDELAYLNRRITRHKSTALSTLGRVFYWSLIQIGLLVAVVGFQVSYLRGIFEKKRMI